MPPARSILLVLALALSGCAAAPPEPEAPAAPTPEAATPPASEAPAEEAPPQQTPPTPEEAPAEPTPATPTPSPEPEPAAPPPEEPAPSTPTPATPPPTPAPTPTPTPPGGPTVNLTLRHDYSTLPENVTMTIPEGATDLQLDVSFPVGMTAVGTYGCTGPLRIKVLRPDASTHIEVLASQGTAGSPHARCGEIHQGAPPPDIPPGNWLVEFSGQGVGHGLVTVRSAA